ncbi:hypothetical protein ACR5KS_09010 [Leucobacter sp. W1153]|uniref:hypothetical protein n=1 Tax=Leucobacter sp. W1153 TaxID=3439064 RepID=UPI003F3E80C2
MVATVAAVCVAGVGVSSASAVTPDPKTISDCVGQTPPIAQAQQILCLQILARVAAGDYSPRDMQVAAPSSVIAATASDTAEKRVQEVNRWRPNPQAFIDAKSRLAQSSGLTTEQLDSVGRWAPKLVKAGSLVGVLSGDSLVSWVVRDGILKPQLEGIVDVDQTLRATYCVRQGNFATDWLTGHVVGGCADWRVLEEYNEAFQRTAVGVQGSMCHAGYCYNIVSIKSEYDVRVQQGNPLPAHRRNMYVCRTTSGSHSDAGSPVAQVAFLTATGVHWYTPGGGSGYNWLSCANQGASVSYSLISTAHYGDASVFPSPVGARLLVGTEVVSELDPVTSDGSEWITKVRCLDGSTRHSVSSAFVAQAGVIASSIPSSVELGSCEPVGVDVGIQRQGKGSSGISSRPFNDPSEGRSQVGGAEVPQPVRDWQTSFPNCWDGSCLLELRKVIGGTMEMDCFNAPEQCLNWSTEVASDPTTYRCYYGGSLVGIAECNVYTRVFDRDKVQQGTAYADPSTGTGVTTSTGTAVTTNPGAATTAMSSGVMNPSQPRQCFPSGWGAFNPFEWVLQPVKCALEWAFVPRESVFSSFRANVSGRFAQTSFGAVAGIVTAVNVPGVGDGCTGPPLSFKFGQIDETWYPFSACDAPMAGIAATIKLWLGFLITAGAVFAIIRYVTAIIGFIPYGGGSGSGGGRRGPKFEAVDD